jgi:hypothetical protein
MRVARGVRRLLAGALVGLHAPVFAARALEPFRPDARRVAECESTFEPRAAMRKLSFSNDLQQYYLCKAMAAKSLQPCAELEGLRGKRHDFKSQCEQTYSHVLFAKGLIERSDEAWPHCEPLLTRTMRVSEDGGGAARRQAICASLVRGDFSAACGAVDGVAGFPVEPGRCVPELRRCLLGEGPDRNAGPGGCDTIVQFRRARAAGDAEVCGANGACRWLMGQGERACRASLDAARVEYCGSPSSYPHEREEPPERKPKPKPAENFDQAKAGA